MRETSAVFEECLMPQHTYLLKGYTMRSIRSDCLGYQYTLAQFGGGRYTIGSGSYHSVWYRGMGVGISKK